MFQKFLYASRVLVLTLLINSFQQVIETNLDQAAGSIVQSYRLCNLPQLYF